MKGLTSLATLAGAVIVTLLLLGCPATGRRPVRCHCISRRRTHGCRPSTPPTTSASTASRAWLLALNAGVFLLGALAISRKTTDRLRFYCTLVLLTEAATTGVLLSIDLLLFYMFWEGMLVPLYVLLSNWGGEKRGPATLKFIVYTVAGSLLMLVAIIYLYIQSAVGLVRPREHPRPADQLGLCVRHTAHPCHDIHAQGTRVHLLRARVRDQDPDRPAAHVAARPLRGMPAGRAGVLRRHRQQARRVRLHPLRADALPRTRWKSTGSCWLHSPS